jgi:cysteine desulfurases, SufS subfamily
MDNKYRKDFPILSMNSKGEKLAYLDNAATTQKPSVVIEAVNAYYSSKNANPHRGAYELSVEATECYEEAREIVKEFINAGSSREIIFTKNATEAFNMLAYSYGLNNIEKNDEIVISIAEHHSNLVPWQNVARIKGAKLVYMYLDEMGTLSDSEIEEKITDKTKLVSVTHISNVLGTINPIKKIIEKAHSIGAKVIVDIAQSVGHKSIDVMKWDTDFAVFSGHKMFAPMGVGVLYGKEELLEAMPPFLMGGDMIEYVSEQSSTWAKLPQKFEAGTQDVGAVTGLSSAIKYMQSVGIENIEKMENELTAYALNKLNETPNIEIYGLISPENRSSVISFNVVGVHPHDVASILDAEGIAVRSGHHCAHPLMKYLKVNATCRVSFCFYNTKEEIDRFIEALKGVRRWLRLES